MICFIPNVSAAISEPLYIQAPDSLGTNYSLGQLYRPKSRNCYLVFDLLELLSAQHSMYFEKLCKQWDNLISLLTIAPVSKIESATDA